MNTLLEQYFFRSIYFRSIYHLFESSVAFHFGAFSEKNIVSNTPESIVRQVPAKTSTYSSAANKIKQRIKFSIKYPYLVELMQRKTILWFLFPECF